MAITIFSPHIIHEINMREIIFVDILYELGYGFFIGFGVKHLPIPFGSRIEILLSILAIVQGICQVPNQGPLQQF